MKTLPPAIAFLVICLFGHANAYVHPAIPPSLVSTTRSARGLSLRRGMCMSSAKKGVDWLPEDTIERAKAGNKFEKVKLEKDPTTVYTDVHEYAAAIRSGNMKWEDLHADDIDIRLKWAGMFHRKKATPGRFMMRLRIPNGIITSEMMRYFADTVRPYGYDKGVVDITTRANIQLRGVPLEDGSGIISSLQGFGITCLMSGLDNVRNMVGSPIAGIDPLEMYDTRSLTKALEDWYTNNGKGNSEWGNLPRKFNIAVSGGRDDFAHTSINDIGLNPVPHSETGDIGFNIDLGGYMSIKRAAKSIPMGVWIPETDALDFCKAVLRIFRDMGARKDRQKARLMWLIEEMGMDSFKETVRKEMSEYKGSEYVFTAEQHHKEEWTHGHRSTLGVNTQKQDGMSWVGVHVPVGRLHPDECEELAALADKYSAGEMRLTVEQNVLFPNVDNAKIEEFRNEPVFTKEDAKFSIDPSNILGHVISCTGAQFCPVALVETKYEIDAFTRELDKIVDMPKAVRIHMTGCPNSCGQAQVADIGLMGAPAKKDGKAVPGVNIFVGGQIGENALLAMDPEIKGIPMTSEDLVPVLANLLVERFGGKLKANFADLVSSEVGSKIKADA